VKVGRHKRHALSFRQISELVLAYRAVRSMKCSDAPSIQRQHYLVPLILKATDVFRPEQVATDAVYLAIRCLIAKPEIIYQWPPCFAALLTQVEYTAAQSLQFARTPLNVVFVERGLNTKLSPRGLQVASLGTKLLHARRNQS
jgi:hypothetical protein